jgi:hypothetical protein
LARFFSRHARLYAVRPPECAQISRRRWRSGRTIRTIAA